jgi:protein-disulfide isomerase
MRNGCFVLATMLGVLLGLVLVGTSSEVQVFPLFPGDTSDLVFVTAVVEPPGPTTLTPPAGHIVQGVVAEMPPCEGLMRGVNVILLPTNRTTQTSVDDGSFSFYNVLDGSYQLAVSPLCNPFGCWREMPITVSGADVSVRLCPEAIITPVPTATYPPFAQIQPLNCANYPLGCVPLVGGGDPTGPLAHVESPDTRTLDQPSQGASGVVRGLTPDGAPFIGDPAARIHFALIEDFTCPHCQEYHRNDLKRFIQDYVLTGKATLEVFFMSYTPTLSETADAAALCAGEQGALWEMEGQLLAQGDYTFERIQATADQMGLDGAALIDCIQSERYRPILKEYTLFANDRGVSAVPSMMVRYDGSDEWKLIDRSYDNLAALVEAAQ